MSNDSVFSFQADIKVTAEDIKDNVLLDDLLRIYEPLTVELCDACNADEVIAWVFDNADDNADVLERAVVKYVEGNTLLASLIRRRTRPTVEFIASTAGVTQCMVDGFERGTIMPTYRGDLAVVFRPVGEGSVMTFECANRVEARNMLRALALLPDELVEEEE